MLSVGDVEEPHLQLKIFRSSTVETNATSVTSVIALWTDNQRATKRMPAMMVWKRANESPATV